MSNWQYLLFRCYLLRYYSSADSGFKSVEKARTDDDCSLRSQYASGMFDTEEYLRLHSVTTRKVLLHLDLLLVPIYKLCVSRKRAFTASLQQAISDHES